MIYIIVNIYIEEIHNILDAINSELNNSQSGKFIKTINHIILRIIDCNGNLETLQDIISIIRRIILNLMQDKKQQLKAENLWEQARVLISEAISRHKSFKALKEKIFSQSLSNISAKLITTYNMNKLLIYKILYNPIFI